MTGWSVDLPAECADCDGKLTVTQDASDSCFVVLHCPAGHQTTVSWPHGHPELRTVTSPAAARSFAAQFRACFNERADS